jgi:hypothetical protein
LSSVGQRSILWWPWRGCLRGQTLLSALLFWTFGGFIAALLLPIPNICETTILGGWPLVTFTRRSWSVPCHVLDIAEYFEQLLQLCVGVRRLT